MWLHIMQSYHALIKLTEVLQTFLVDTSKIVLE